MENKSKQSTENFIKDIRRRTRRVFSSEQKIMIVMEAQRGEHSVAELCRKHAISQAMFYKWNKEFMEAGLIIFPGIFVGGDLVFADVTANNHPLSLVVLLPQF